MYLPVLIFEILCWGAFAALATYFAVESFRLRKVTIGMWMVIGCLSISWLEAPFDNAMYAVFHPDFHRLPEWGPLGATHGQLPLIAPPGYVLYFLVPALIGVFFANKGIRKFGWKQGPAYLLCGLAAGATWDGLIETIQANTVHLWSFGRAVPGLNVASDKIGLTPVQCYLAMAVFIAPVAWALGAKNDQGESVLLAGISSRLKPGPTRKIGLFVGVVAVANFIYGMSYLPHMLVNELNMMTVSGDLIPFGPGEGYDPIFDVGQPGIMAEQSNGALGALLLWGWLITMVLVMLWGVRRIDSKLEGGSAAREQTKVAA